MSRLELSQIYLYEKEGPEQQHAGMEMLVSAGRPYAGRAMFEPDAL
jgi:hypothetical protein